MSLRARLVLLLGGLVAVLLAAEWWLVRTLTRTLDEEVDVVAFSVGSSMLSLFATPEAPVELESVEVSPLDPSGGEPPAQRGARIARRRLAATWDSMPFAEGSAVEVHRVRGTDPTEAVIFSRTEPADLELYVLATDLSDGAFVDVADLVRTEPRAVVQGDRFETIRTEVSAEFVRAPEGSTDRTGLGEREVHFELRLGESRWTPTAAPGEPPPIPAGAEPVRIPVPRKGLDRAVDGFLSQLLLGSLGLFVVGLGAIGWVAHRVTRPLRSLADAAGRVGSGELGTVVPEDGDRELAATLRAFNGMSKRLAALDAEAQRLRDREHLGQLGDVARGLAHALRNPLHTLGLAVDSLAGSSTRGRGDDDAVVAAARTQIRRIDSALESFLTLAGAGGAREPVDLTDLARDVALELVQSPVPVTVDVTAEGSLVPVEGVRAELRAVLHALVVNAAEAAPDTPVRVCITCSEESPRRVRVEVLDRGPGIAPEVRARLFTPHVTTKAHGTGMGLFLAERIARTRYDGRLTLQDRDGGGNRAVLELSVAEHASVASASGASASGASASGASASGVSASGVAAA